MITPEQARKAYTEFSFYTKNMNSMAMRVGANLDSDSDLGVVYELVVEEKFGAYPYLLRVNGRVVQAL